MAKLTLKPKKLSKLTLRLNLTVTYATHGVPTADLIHQLENLIHTGIGEGLLTGDTDAEVETHEVTVTRIPNKGERTLPAGLWRTRSSSL